MLGELLYLSDLAMLCQKWHGKYRKNHSEAQTRGSNLSHGRGRGGHAVQKYWAAGRNQKVEMIDFHFNVHRGGMVTFENPYEEDLAYIKYLQGLQVTYGYAVCKDGTKKMPESVVII